MTTVHTTAAGCFTHWWNTRNTTPLQGCFKVFHNPLKHLLTWANILTDLPFHATPLKHRNTTTFPQVRGGFQVFPLLRRGGGNPHHSTPTPGGGRPS